MPRRLPLAELAVALAVVVLVLAALSRCGSAAPTAASLRASWTRTPGVLNPEVTEATLRTTVCARGWTRTIRPPTSYTSEHEPRQMREYGVAGSPSDYQEDHLISLELGGHPTDPRNLWPEPRPRAEEVDAIENELNRQVCAGELTLRDAQRKISEIKHRDG
jgi:hypothetical protein